MFSIQEIQDKLRDAINNLTDSTVKLLNDYRQEVEILNSVATLNSNTFLMCTNILQVYKSLVNRDLPNEHDVSRVSLERESGIFSYKQAISDFENGSYGGALKHITDAINEFSKTSSTKKFLGELKQNKSLLAEFYFLKGQILFSQGKFSDSVSELKKSLENNSANAMCCNLIAFIYIQELGDCNAARKYLLNSIDINGTQLFANFYLAKLDNNYLKMDEIVSELPEIYQTKKSADDHSVVSGFVDVTPPISLPYILLERLEKKISKEQDSVAIARAINEFNGYVSKLPSGLKKKCSITLFEIQVKAFMRMSELKKTANEFDLFDQEFCSEYGLKLYSSKQFFFEYSADFIDSTFYKIFPKGINSDFLYGEKYIERVAQFIAQHAKFGKLMGDDNKIVDLRKITKKMQQANNEEKIKLNKELVEKCKDKDVIKIFIENKFLGKGCTPWFEVMNMPQKPASLFYLLCEEHNVNLFVYTKNKDGLIPQNELCQITENTEFKSIHIVYHKDSGQFTLLQQLTSPSRLYRRIALDACADLIRRDNMNFVAWEILSKRGYIQLPKIAETLSKEGKLKSTSPIMGYLKQYCEKFEDNANLKEEKEIVKSLFENLPMEIPRITLKQILEAELKGREEEFYNKLTDDQRNQLNEWKQLDLDNRPLERSEEIRKWIRSVLANTAEKPPLKHYGLFAPAKEDNSFWPKVRIIIAALALGSALYKILR